ncbi:colicin [Pseudomonas syringae]|uniref:colicin n=1 Tax=Pseudomonas syringae TaxID=317 RepID=UPI003F7AE72B
MKNLPDWLVLCVWRALIGEIYPAIRAIALSLTDDRTLLIRYYLDREPIDFDWESLEVITTNISASIGQEKILLINLECKFGQDSIGSLERFGGFVYCRREYEL